MVKEERIGYSSLFFVRARLLAEEEATKYFLGGRVVLTDEGYLWAVEREMACATIGAQIATHTDASPLENFWLLNFKSCNCVLACFARIQTSA